MGSVIEIRFSEDLPTRLQNKLRYRMEMAQWLATRRRLIERAERTGDPYDYNAIDYHDAAYERVGLP